MSAPIIAFFNPAGGVGTTTHVYHLAWMFSDLGLKVLAADFDPQANLTETFFGEEVLGDNAPSIYTCVKPLVTSGGEVGQAETWIVSEGIRLLAGDLRFAGLEDLFATGWFECRDGKERGFVVTSSPRRILTQAAANSGVDVVLVDLGPNLGAVNRATLLAADYLVVPLKVGLSSSHRAMQTLGEKIRDWQSEWARILEVKPALVDCPAGNIQRIGYVIQERALRLNQSQWPYEISAERVPGEFRQEVLGVDLAGEEFTAEDPWRLALLRHYHSLMYLAQDAHKPMFSLAIADGATSSQLEAAQRIGQEYKLLAERIAKAVGLKLPYFSGSVA